MNYRLTIPPNTTEQKPLSMSYDIGREKINKMIVRIPDGHKYLAHFQVLSKGQLIIPEFGSGERYLVGNDNIVEIDPPSPIILAGPPFEITLRGWNEDDTYQHAFLLEIY